MKTIKPRDLRPGDRILYRSAHADGIPAEVVSTPRDTGLLVEVDAVGDRGDRFTLRFRPGRRVRRAPEES